MVKKKLERSKGKYYSGHEVKLKGRLSLSRHTAKQGGQRNRWILIDYVYPALM